MRASDPRPIVVVEDSDEDFDTIQEAARRARLPNPLLRATTGGGCLELLRGLAAEPVRPALVLMDLNTPGLDGREALREIKADARLGALPVVVLSTSSDPRDLAFCYTAGANAYHLKPVRYTDHLQVLLDVFAYWLDRVVLPDRRETTP